MSWKDRNIVSERRGKGPERQEGKRGGGLTWPLPGGEREKAMVEGGVGEGGRGRDVFLKD